MTVGDILDGAFRGLRATFGPVAVLVLVLIAPVTLISNLVLARLAPSMVGQGFGAFMPDMDAPVGIGEPFALFGVSAVAGLIGFLLALVIGAAVVAMALAVDRGEQPELGPAIRSALGVLGTTLGASVLLGIGGIVLFVGFTIVSVLVLLVPVAGIIIWVVVFLPGFVVLGALLVALMSLVVPVAVTERQGITATLSRVWWVLRVQPWRVLGITLLIGLIIAVVTFALQLPFIGVAGLVPAGGWAVESVGEVLAQLVSLPVGAFAALLVYLDARMRHEGLDIALRSRALGSP